MNENRNPRREKDRLASELSGRKSQLPMLAELFDHWRKENPHPQFRLFGLWNPNRYDWAQGITARGPNAWESHAAELAAMADWHSVLIRSPTIEVFERFLEGPVGASDAPLKQRLLDNCANYDVPPSEALRQLYIRDCGNFFSRVAQVGLARATAVLAANQNYEKPGRRYEHLDEVLCFCIPDSDERLRLFQEVMKGPERQDPVARRPDAIRFLPPLITKDARLAAALRNALQDDDTAIRFWAAFHLSEIEPATPGLGRHLLAALRTRISDGYEDSVDSDEFYAQHALARLDRSAVRDTIRSLVEQSDWEILIRYCLLATQRQGAEAQVILAEAIEQLKALIASSPVPGEPANAAAIGALNQIKRLPISPKESL